MKYILEQKIDDKWCAYGTYTEKSLAQLVQASIMLDENGFKMYSGFRIKAVDDNDKTHIL